MAELTYRRVHRAPPGVLFDCMTVPEHLTRFWGPAGTSTPRDGIVVELRPGGRFETTIIGAAGVHVMRAVYAEVDRPHRLAWVEPESGMRTEITFTDLGDGRTEVVTRQTDVPAGYSADGFATALDRFDTYLSTLMGDR